MKKEEKKLSVVPEKRLHLHISYLMNETITKRLNFDAILISDRIFIFILRKI